MGYLEELVIDNGGAYRAVLTDIMDELKAGHGVTCLHKTKANDSIYILNETVDDQGHDNFSFIGGLLAFSFLSR